MEYSAARFGHALEPREFALRLLRASGGMPASLIAFFRFLELAPVPSVSPSSF